MKCKDCGSKNLISKGSYQTKRGSVNRLQCKACGLNQSKRTGTENHRKRKQHLKDKITTLYCEGMSMRAIARALKINRKTVNRYFLENSKTARTRNLKRLQTGQIVTTYVQFDELETFEHTKKKPLGVEASIRAKTGEIISMKVGTIHVKGLTVSKEYIKTWNSQTNRRYAIADMLFETQHAMKKDYAMIACDNSPQPVKIAKDIFGDGRVQVLNSSQKNKRIDLTFLKLRQDISRLRRRTLATTKNRDRLQNHLDLYTDYHNLKRIA